jgi:hypothetical protein
MGLDMYLNASKHLYREDDSELVEKIKKMAGTAMIPSRIVFRAMYWRKANAIHKWFVDNVQDDEDDCREYDVDIDQLKTLCSLLDKMLSMPKEEAIKLLPTTSGFFFGSTEYDEWYWKDIEETRDRLNELLSDPTIDDYYFTYQSSW